MAYCFKSNLSKSLVYNIVNHFLPAGYALASKSQCRFGRVDGGYFLNYLVCPSDSYSGYELRLLEAKGIFFIDVLQSVYDSSFGYHLSYLSSVPVPYDVLLAAGALREAA